VLWFGRLRGLNTNAFNEGDILYASTTSAGGFQTTIPTGNNNLVQVAAVIKKSVNQGVIFIRPQIEPLLFKPENVANKSTTTTLGTSDTLYPTQNAVKTYADTKVDKVTTSGVERAYIINPDGSQGTKATSDFGGTETFNQSTWEFSDFVDESGNQKPFIGQVLAGGSQDAAVFSDTGQDYIGARLFFSGTSANGGFRYLNNTNPGYGGMRSVAGLTFYGIFKLISQSDARDRVIRIGFHNATNHVAPPDGAYLEILGSTATFKTRNNTVESASSSVVLASGTVVGGVFYKILIEFTSTTSVHFKLVDNSGTVVLNTTLSTNLPHLGRRFGFGLVATIATAGASHQIMTIDYMGMGRQKPNFLNGF
jgi:hypothetical protein